MSLLDEMELESMTDRGMWVWAALVTVIGLVASYVIAVAWQRWKERKKPNE